jgi:hypothetical protein
MEEWQGVVSGWWILLLGIGGLHLLVNGFDSLR